MKPSVGRIVHQVSMGSPIDENGYQKYGSVCRAAMVTEVPDMLPEGPNTGPTGYVKAVHLAVVNPSGFFFDKNVPYDDEDRAGGTWHWPDHVM